MSKLKMYSPGTFSFWTNEIFKLYDDSYVIIINLYIDKII